MLLKAASGAGRAAGCAEHDCRIKDRAVENRDVLRGIPLDEELLATRAACNAAVEVDAGSKEERSSDARDELWLVFAGGDPDVDVAGVLNRDRLECGPEVGIGVLPAVASLMPYTLDWPGDEAGSISTMAYPPSGSGMRM